MRSRRRVRRRMLNNGGNWRRVRFVRSSVHRRRWFRVRGTPVLASTLVAGTVVMLGGALVVRDLMLEHMLVVIRSRGLFRGDLVFVVIRVGTMLRGEMLRVPVVRGPKTFGESIFHAKSLSQDQASMRRRRTEIS
jgi:hypothetical protein